MKGRIWGRRSLIGTEFVTEMVYEIDGEEVTADKFYEAFPQREPSADALTFSPTTWPQQCDALAVHPSQVEEAREDAKRKGVPTDFTPDGRPVITSAAHQKQYAKLYGFRPKRGY